jgi:hypothetical protein
VYYEVVVTKVIVRKKSINAMMLRFNSYISWIDHLMGWIHMNGRLNEFVKFE